MFRVLLMILSCSCSLAMAQPKVTAINPSGNIVWCDSADSAAESYLRLKASFESLKRRIEGLPGDSREYNNGIKVLETFEPTVKDAAERAKAENGRVMGWVSVEMDRRRGFIVDRAYSQELGVPKVQITPADQMGQGILVPHQTVEIKFFARGLCPALKAAKGDYNAAVKAAVTALFAD